jgi:hypothetical protein
MCSHICLLLIAILNLLVWLPTKGVVLGPVAHSMVVAPSASGRERWPLVTPLEVSSIAEPERRRAQAKSQPCQDPENALCLLPSMSEGCRVLARNLAAPSAIGIPTNKPGAICMLAEQAQLGGRNEPRCVRYRRIEWAARRSSRLDFRTATRAERRGSCEITTRVGPDRGRGYRSI